jgi:hypothetical protein
MYSCTWFGQISGCTSTEKYDRLLQLPLYALQSASETMSTNDLMDPNSPYTNLKREFDRNYAANRAPIGVWGHYNQYYEYQSRRLEIIKFLKYARSKPGVWVVTMRQLADWMSAPVGLSGMNTFMAAYKCPSSSRW